MTKHKGLSWLFYFVVLGDLYAVQSDMTALNYFFKPLIMVWIVLFFNYQWKGEKNQIYTWAMGAFFFSWIGDILLMFQDISPLYFPAGLGSFLIAQILYIVTFHRSGHADWLSKHKGIPLLLMVYGVVLYIGMWTQLDIILKFAVPLYAASILGMVLSALNRKGKVPVKSYQWVAIGAILFLVSDSLIAVNQFVSPIPNAGLYIMITYIAAQRLIAQGLSEQTA